MVQPDKIYNNGKNGEVGQKQARKEDQFEISRSSSIYKRILIVDDEPDIAISLKMVLDSSNDDDKQKIKIDVTSYTDPVEALSDFKPMPVGDHKIELEVIRVPLEANQPVEHDVDKWDIKVVP